MRAPLIFALALALGVWAPRATALDAFPEDSHWGATVGRALVRLPHGGHLRVEAAPANGIKAALAPIPGRAPSDPPVALPAGFDVVPRGPDGSWHGLGGTVELVLHRDDPGSAVEIFAQDEEGGAVFEWPAALRGVDAPSVLAALGIAANVGLAWRAHHAK